MHASKSAKRPSSPAVMMSSSRFQSRLSDSPMTPSAVQSHYDVQNYVIKTSMSIPVLVNEALSTNGSNANTSMQFSEDGWAWIIINMKLFVWKIGQGRAKRVCKELMLDSNRQYHAQLTVVGQNEKNDGVISAVALTSDGYITFWPNIIRSVTTAMYLDGPELVKNEEFLKVLPFKGKGYIAVTTTGDLYELNPDGHAITRTQLHRSAGVLAGIGRRVSSLFFSQERQEDIVDFVLLHTSAAGCDILLLTAKSLQRRNVFSSNHGGHNQLVCEVNINDLLMEKISQALWSELREDFEIMPMDITMSLNNSSIAVLVACTERQSMNTTLLKYCVCICPLSVLKDARDDASLDEVYVIQIDHSDMLLDGNELNNYSSKLVIPNVSSHGLQYAVIWSKNRVIMKTFGKDGHGHEELLPIEPADYILGAGEFHNHAVLFESTKGMLSVEPVPLLQNTSFGEAVGAVLDSSNVSRDHMIQDQLSYTLLPTPKVLKTEELDSSVTQAQRLQSAFIHFNHMNISHARKIIKESFAGEDKIALLKDAVVSMSLDLIDDFPALDPRWAESLPQGNSSSSSLILQHQLRDKQKAHQLFMNFLTEVSLWDKLASIIRENGQMICVQWILIEHQEKLEAAVALANKHVEKQGILDLAIGKIIEKRSNHISNHELTVEDVFYRQVSRIQDIFEGILDVEEEAISNSAMSSRDICRLVIGANEVFETVLTAVHGLRKRRDSYHKDKDIEFCPWTVSSRHDSLREALFRQHTIIFTYGIPEVDDAQTRSTFFAHAVTLTDILLSEYQWQLESLASAPSLSARSDEVTEAFRRHRSATISPLLKAGLFEKAAMLAEKFKDFNILMEILDHKDNERLLLEYVTKFEKFGFIDTFFAWLLERGKFHKLLHYTTCEKIASEEFTKRAADFMSSHPKINWLHQIKTNDFISAHKTLLYLALTESRSSAVKNHYVSLSKLAAAFSDEPKPVSGKAVSDSTSQQTLIKYQETLPSVVLQNLGVTLDDMPVYSAEELIKLYIGDDNVQANEVDFMKALDLLSFIPQTMETEDEISDHDTVSEFMDLKHQIWCKAILRDSWHEINCGIDNLKASSHTVLAKTLVLALQSGMVLEYLPDLDHLFQQKPLASVKENVSSQFLVRLNFQHYEHQVLAS